MAASRVPEDRWAWVEVDTGAIRRNTRALKGMLSRGTQLMCAVKADAYGHGAVPCARAMRASGANQFAVATVAEGVELREAGIREPVLVLAEPPAATVATLVEHDLMPTVYTAEFALAFGEAAAAAGTVGRYHLAVDTGMTRIGVMPEDAVELRHAIDFHRGLRCAGTFTHFATADVPEDWDFRLQLNRFVETVRALKAAGYDCGLVHCDNTPGIVLHREAHFDMARAGIGLYGLHPAASTARRIELAPAMSVRARVTRVVYPSFGTGVSYGAAWRVPKQGVAVATIPIGYADGLARACSGAIDVAVRGRRAQQVGNICMDQCMVAVGWGAVEIGDVVTLVGRDGDAEITADEMAAARRTINYEVTCDFGCMRLERVYV